MSMREKRIVLCQTVRMAVIRPSRAPTFFLQGTIFC